MEKFEIVSLVFSGLAIIISVYTFRATFKRDTEKEALEILFRRYQMRWTNNDSAFDFGVLVPHVKRSLDGSIDKYLEKDSSDLPVRTFINFICFWVLAGIHIEKNEISVKAIRRAFFDAVYVLEDVDKFLNHERFSKEIDDRLRDKFEKVRNKVSVKKKMV